MSGELLIQASLPRGLGGVLASSQDPAAQPGLVHGACGVNRQDVGVWETAGGRLPLGLSFGTFWAGVGVASLSQSPGMPCARATVARVNLTALLGAGRLAPALQMRRLRLRAGPGPHR